MTTKMDPMKNHEDKKLSQPYGNDWHVAKGCQLKTQVTQLVL